MVPELEVEELKDGGGIAPEEPSNAFPWFAGAFPAELGEAGVLRFITGSGAGAPNSAPNDGIDRPKRSPGGSRDSSVSSRRRFGSRGRRKQVARLVFHWFNQNWSENREDMARYLDRRMQ